MADLEIHLLGLFRVTVDGQPLEERRWTRKKSKTLVKLLALEPTRQLHREQLIEILWPEMDAEQAVNNLNKAVHAARRSLEPDLAAGQPSRFLQTQESFIALRGTGSLWIDVAEFEKIANEAKKTPSIQLLEAASTLYAGDLLEEDLYEDWSSLRREQLRLVYQRVLDSLANAHESTAQSERAIEVLERLVSGWPANEDAHRRLMRLHFIAGQRHLALSQYRICCEALRQEMDAPPEAATTQLYEQILQGVESPAGDLKTDEAQVNVVKPEPKQPKWPLVAAIMVVIGAIVLFLATKGTASLYKPRQINSLAALPFTAGGSSADLGFLGDGITEGVIDSLSQVQGVRVMARSTVFRYKDRGMDPIAIGRELKVGAVLTGSITQRGDAIAVNTELVNVEDGSRIWGREYSLPSSDLTRLQQGLGPEIVAALQVKLTADQRDRMDHRYTEDPQAYRLYMLARHFWNRRTAEGFRKSIEYYEQAIQHDPGYAQAYAGLADSYGLLAFRNAPASEFTPKARAAATKALELDDRLAEAHTSLGMIHALYDWDREGALNEFRRALELNPGYSTAHHWYGVQLGAMSRFDLASKELQRALELDPLSPIIHLNLGYPLYYQHQYKEAEAAYRKSLEIDPSFAPAHQDLAKLYAVSARPTESIQEGVRLLQLDGEPDLAERVHRKFEQGGYQAAVKEWAAALEFRSRTKFVEPVTLAELYLRLGRNDDAMRWLARAFEERSAQLTYLKVDPQYDALRGDRRFEDLLRRIGLS